MNQWVDQDGNRGTFRFKQKGVTFVVSEVQDNVGLVGGQHDQPN